MRRGRVGDKADIKDKNKKEEGEGESESGWL
jgi:hypothetical protein